MGKKAMQNKKNIANWLSAEILYWNERREFNFEFVSIYFKY